jgi:hypothetical protein
VLAPLRSALPGRCSAAGRPTTARCSMSRPTARAAASAYRVDMGNGCISKAGVADASARQLLRLLQDALLILIHSYAREAPAPGPWRWVEEGVVMNGRGAPHRHRGAVEAPRGSGGTARASVRKNKTQLPPVGLAVN